MSPILPLPCISRAHIELLGLQPQTPYPEPETLEHIHFLDEARFFLMRQMHVTGQWQAGVAFGERDGGLLTIMHVAPFAPPVERSEHGPFKRNVQYLLGYAEAILATYHGRVDWAAYWLARPNSQALTAQEELLWLKEASDLGLIDSQTPLLIAGYQDGELTVNAYKTTDGQLTRLTVSL